MAELPVAKSALVAADCVACATEDEALATLREHPALTAAERSRMPADPTRWTRILPEIGASVVPAFDLPAPRVRPNPPTPALFVRGDVGLLERPIVGLVGTRNFTPYGEAAAFKFAQELAREGVVVLSGGAFGIDAAAHRGALDVGGATIAVLPSGIDRPYPPGNRALIDAIAEKGLVVSGFGLGFVPRKDSYLARNVVSAALCDALLVVEAPEKSGAIHTAGQAAEMGLPVFVVPGPITHDSFRGSHELIRNGATLADHPGQILDDLNIMRGTSAVVSMAPAMGHQADILKVLGPDPISVDRVSELTGLSPDSLMGELTLLELDGRILRTSLGIALAP